MINRQDPYRGNAFARIRRAAENLNTGTGQLESLYEEYRVERMLTLLEESEDLDPDMIWESDFCEAETGFDEHMDA